MSANRSEQDDIRALMGRYATGALTEAEQKRLFDAALENQDLFDELAGEHSLKQFLDSPGVRNRLAAALAPPSRRKVSAWLWAAASAATALVVVVAGVALFRKESPRYLAQAIPPVAISSPSAAALPTLPSERLPKKTPPKTVQSSRSPAEPEPAEFAAVRKASVQESTARAQNFQEPNAPEPKLQEKAQIEAEPTREARTTQVPPIPSPAVGGFRALSQTPLLQSTTLGALAGFGFRYEVTPDSKLRVTPVGNGFLTVTLSAETGGQGLASNESIRSGVVYEYSVPNSAAGISIVFSAQATTPGPAATPASAGADPPSGVKIDPNPSLQSRLTAVIPLSPRTVR